MWASEVDRFLVDRDAETLTAAGWEPCSPEWLAAHPGECGTAPRVAGYDPFNMPDGLVIAHWHPTVTRAEVLAEARTEVVGFLVKKSREYHGAPANRFESKADVLASMASKVSRGAVRVLGSDPTPARAAASTAKLRSLLAGGTTNAVEEVDHA